MDHTAGGVLFQLYPRARKKRPSTLICYHVGSRRVQLVFKGDAEAAKKQCKTLAKSVTCGEAIDALHMTALDRRIYVAAKELLAPHGCTVDGAAREYIEARSLLGSRVSIREAAAFWVKHNVSPLPVATVAAVVAELLLFLEKNKQRARVTVGTLRSILDPFAAAFQMPIAHVRTAEIERWLGSQHHAPRTLNNYRAAILRLFNFARGRFLPKDSPTAAHTLERVTYSRGAVEIFRPWEIAAMLTQAPDELLPLIVLGAFAGLRNCELSRIEWNAFRPEPSAEFPHGYIEVSKSAAKQHRTASRRIVPIQPNLARWLEPYRFREGPVSPYRHQSSIARAVTRLIDGINEREGKARRRIIGRPENGLRHSYGSYRLPIVKSAAALAIEMNNSEAEIWRDYHELVPPADVETWWKISPVDMPLFERKPATA